MCKKSRSSPGELPASEVAFQWRFMSRDLRATTTMQTSEDRSSFTWRYRGKRLNREMTRFWNFCLTLRSSDDVIEDGEYPQLTFLHHVLLPVRYPSPKAGVELACPWWTSSIVCYMCERENLDNVQTWFSRHRPLLLLRKQPQLLEPNTKSTRKGWGDGSWLEGVKTYAYKWPVATSHWRWPLWC